MLNRSWAQQGIEVEARLNTVVERYNRLYYHTIQSYNIGLVPHLLAPAYNSTALIFYR